MVAAFNRLRVDTRKLKGLRQCTMARAKWRVGVATRFTRVPTTSTLAYVRTFDWRW